MKTKECGFSHKLNGYIDGELSETEFKKVRSHLKDCRVCQEQLRELTNLNSFLNRYQEETVPEYLNQRILASVKEKENEESHSWFHKNVIGFSVAASLVISFFTGIILSDLAYQKSHNNSSTIALNFGNETLYSYYEVGE